MEGLTNWLILLSTVVATISMLICGAGVIFPISVIVALAGWGLDKLDKKGATKVIITGFAISSILLLLLLAIPFLIAILSNIPKQKEWVSLAIWGAIWISLVTTGFIMIKMGLKKTDKGDIVNIILVAMISIIGFTMIAYSLPYIKPAINELTEQKVEPISRPLPTAMPTAEPLPPIPPTLPPRGSRGG